MRRCKAAGITENSVSISPAGGTRGEDPPNPVPVYSHPAVNPVLRSSYNIAQRERLAPRYDEWKFMEVVFGV